MHTTNEVLIQTLLFCSDFLLHYMIVFVIVIGNFTLGGYILFGGQARCDVGR